MNSANTLTNTATSTNDAQTGHSVPYADRTAIYCRRSRKDDRKQISVNRQKRLALQDCEKLGLTVSKENILTDPGVSAWQRNRKRPGWDKLLEAARRGEIKHIVCYHPDRLMRQPFDLEELLNISDQYGIILYGRVNRKDLQDPDDRYALRIEVAHACRSSDDTSRRVRDEKKERAEMGLYNGNRPHGYTKNGMRINPVEAEIVKEIFRRFTNGETPSQIATDLNRRGIKTARGKAWSDTSVRRQLRVPHVAGIVIYQGKEIGKGKWPAIIDRPTWDFAQELLTHRSKAAANKPKNQRTYLLRGLVVCGKCGTSMTGCSGKVYRCARAIRQDSQRCARTFHAENLEQFMQDAAIHYLQKVSVDNRPAPTAQTRQAETEIADDERQLRELNEMWRDKIIDTSEYKTLRREIQARIRANERKTLTTRRPVAQIADLIGPTAPRKWKNLTDERKNAVLRFLFAAVVIGPHDRAKYPNTTDYSRISIEENELT